MLRWILFNSPLCLYQMAAAASMGLYTCIVLAGNAHFSQVTQLITQLSQVTRCIIVHLAGSASIGTDWLDRLGWLLRRCHLFATWHCRLRITLACRLSCLMPVRWRHRGV